MGERNDFCEIAGFLKANDDYALICHTSPDGDTLGCALGLRLALIAMGKRVKVVCEYGVPKIYRFLPGAETVMAPGEDAFAKNAVAIDCADEARLGAAAPVFERAEGRLNIDHHRTNRGYAALNQVDEGAAANAELIYELISRLPVEISAEMATCLYCGLVTDTGNFAYSNTTPKTLTTAASLLERGADNTGINRAVYRSAPQSKRRLLGLTLMKAEYSADGKIAMSILLMEDFAATGAGEEDTEGAIDYLRDVENVEVAVLIRQSAPDTFKVSLRSKLYADVGSIAEQLGGGGHKQAAGYTARGELGRIRGEAERLIAQAVKR